MTEEKQRVKKETTKTHSSNPSFFEQSRAHLNSFRKRKANSSFRAYPELGLTSPSEPIEKI